MERNNRPLFTCYVIRKIMYDGQESADLIGVLPTREKAVCFVEWFNKNNKSTAFYDCVPFDFDFDKTKQEKLRD